ncbi:MAG: hypothetical protein ACXVRS_01380 [Gaiellaceae bacterium]
MRTQPELGALADTHPITCCRLRIHAIGTVYTELRFDRGVPSRIG